MHDRDTMDLSASNSVASSSAGGGAAVDSTVVGEDPVVVGGGRRGRNKAKDKPKKRKLFSASSKSLSAIPDRIQLSMLNSGLIHISKSSAFLFIVLAPFSLIHERIQIPTHSCTLSLFFLSTLLQLVCLTIPLSRPTARQASLPDENVGK